jgi:sulfite dehydrogenase (quinone) subunit SoeC
MKPRHLPQKHADTGNGHAPVRARPRPLPATLLHVCGYNGFGLWMVLGLALAVGVYPDGRGDVLVPLALGAVLVALGVFAACIHSRWMPHWHGWVIGKGSRPTRDALIALACGLPVLAVAGLARGDNTFWATRLSGVAMTLCSLCSLIITAYADARRQAPGIDHHLATQLPLSRVVSATYGGGLWLWLCAAGQGPDQGGMHPMAWIIGLLALSLLRGLVENLRWQAALQRVVMPRGRMELQPGRFLAAVLVYAVPCAALLLMSFGSGWLAFASVAAISCTVGMATELSLYDEALAALPDGPDGPVARQR